MARGFNTTLGSATTDIITTTPSTNSVLRSVFIWVNERASAVHAIWRQQSAGGDVNQLTDNGAGVWVFHRHWTTSLGTWTIVRPSIGTLASIGWSYDGSNAANVPIAYLNGTKPSVSAIVNPTGALTDLTGAPFYLGNDPAFTNCLDGQLAEFAVWDAILTDDEFFALDKGYSALLIRPQSLVEYVPMLRSAVSYRRSATTVSGTAVQPHPRIIMPIFKSNIRKITATPVAAPVLRAQIWM